MIIKENVALYPHVSQVEMKKTRAGGFEGNQAAQLETKVGTYSLLPFSATDLNLSRINYQTIINRLAT